MFKLNAMNICLFIFLFHFASNNEKFFLSIDGTKCEIELDLNSDSGKGLYKILKESNTYSLNMDYSNNNQWFYSKINKIAEVSQSQSGSVYNGQIIYVPSSLDLYIITSYRDDFGTSFEKVGAITQYKVFDEKNRNLQDGKYLIQFLLVEEPKKTVKISFFSLFLLFTILFLFSVLTIFI